MKRVFTLFYKRKLIVVSVVLLLLGSPLLLHALFQPIAFNQSLIELAEMKYGAASVGTYARFFRSCYASGLNILFNRPSRTPPAYADHEAMFSYVFSWIPGYAEVYPTEGYYYFSFHHPERGLLAGSLRLADLDQGHLTLSYFKLCDEEEERGLVSETLHGIEIEKLSDYAYDVRHGGRTVRFRLQDESFIRRRPERLKTIPDEEFVARMHDESGLKFFVFFNHATTSFYYVLDEEEGAADTFEPLGADGHVRGARTGFVFYDDREYGRKVLVGVSFACVKRNDFFDGPGDQMPFRARLRRKLHKAYPSTMLGRGIDVHGVLQGRSRWQRYLISTYHPYGNLEDMIRYNQEALAGDRTDPSTFWTTLTKEWWHTRRWRETVYDKLESEGRSVERIVEKACRNATCRPPVDNMKGKRNQHEKDRIAVRTRS